MNLPLVNQTPINDKKTSVFRALIVLAFLVPLGFLSKHYAGPAHDWVNNSLGGLLYEVFWCVLVALVLPRMHPLKIALIVFSGTCILEVMQRFDWEVLRYIRSFYIGQILIGTTFAVSDFLYYFLGCLIGFATIHQLRK